MLLVVAVNVKKGGGLDVVEGICKHLLLLGEEFKVLTPMTLDIPKSNIITTSIWHRLIAELNLDLFIRYFLNEEVTSVWSLGNMPYVTRRKQLVYIQNIFAVRREPRAEALYSLTSKAKFFCMRLLIRSRMTAADVLVVQSKAVQDLISYDKESEVLVNPVLKERIANVGTSCYSNNTKVVLVPSAYYPHKDLEIFFRIADRCKDILFLLTVGPEHFSRYESRRNVVCLGTLDFKQIDLSIVDTFMLPSYAESFTAVPLEAILWKKRCILRSLETYDRAILDFVELFENDDELVRILNNVPKKVGDTNAVLTYYRNAFVNQMNNLIKKVNV